MHDAPLWWQNRRYDTNDIAMMRHTTCTHLCEHASCIRHEGDVAIVP